VYTILYELFYYVADINLILKITRQI